jgi:hypothetical protein
MKTIVTQTINTCFIYGIIYFIKPSYNILSTYGLAYQITSLILVSGMVTVVYDMFLTLEKLYYFMAHHGVDKSKPVTIFQFELNKKLELPAFDINYKFAFYVIYTFVVSFYGFLVPEASVFLMFFFVIQYWLDKYNLFRRYGNPDNLSFKLTELMLAIYESSIVFFAVGNFIWDVSVHYDSIL